MINDDNRNEVCKRLFEVNKDKLFDLIEYAKSNVPFYRELYKNVVLDRNLFTYEFFTSEIPIIRKKDIIDYPLYNLSDKYLNDKSKLTVEYTSGSTGTPFACYKDGKTRIAYASSLSHLRKQYSAGYSVESKYAKFYGAITLHGIKHRNEIFIDDNVLYIPVLNINDDNLIRNWNAILDYKPIWLTGTSTSIQYLARCVEKYNLPKFEFDFVELNGELVSNAALEYIKSVFDCPVTNHYGMRELWCIGYSCPQNHLHLVEKNIFIEEQYNEEIKDTVLVCTSLKNAAAPLIRYELGDSGRVCYNDECNFNDTNYVIEVTNGRTSCFFSCGGKLVNLFSFALVFKFVVDEKGNNKILQYQVRKISEDKLDIYVVLNKDSVLTDEDVLKIKTDIAENTQICVEVNIITVDYLMANENGKVPEYVDLSGVGEKSATEQ